jgi:nicotinamidase-related amidase
LLLIDVINDLAFTGSEALVAQAEPMALRLAALKRRTSAAGIPAVYINDNFGQALRSRLHRLEHGDRQRSRVAPDCHRAEGNTTESQRLTFRRSRRATVASGRSRQEWKR